MTGQATEPQTPFGERLTALMEERRLSLREVARRAGCSAGYISNIRHGRKFPAEYTANRLDDVLNAGGGLAALAGAREQGNRERKRAGSSAGNIRHESAGNMRAIRICAACKSSYNKGTLCSSCERDAFNAAHGSRHGVPAWIWGTAPMRRMLARVDLGAAVETFRLTAGLTQAEVGKITGWSASMIGMIETGKRDTIYDVRNLLHMIDAFEIPREMLLPAILGHPAVFADHRIARTEARLSTEPDRPATGYKPGEIMHIIAGKLKARGFEITERISGDEVTEITVTNPANRRTGMVHVGCDGYVMWEWLTDIKDRSDSDRITDAVAGLLSGTPEPESGLWLAAPESA